MICELQLVFTLRDMFNEGSNMRRTSFCTSSLPHDCHNAAVNNFKLIFSPAFVVV